MRNGLLSRIKSAFIDHPQQAGETYFQHFLFTVKMSCRLLLCGIALLVHGLFPFLFVDTASKQLSDCHSVLDERAARTNDKKAA